MKDRWMNIGYEDNELKPYKEPEEGVENKRIGNARIVKQLKRKHIRER